MCDQLMKQQYHGGLGGGMKSSHIRIICLIKNGLVVFLLFQHYICFYKAWGTVQYMVKSVLYQTALWVGGTQCTERDISPIWKSASRMHISNADEQFRVALGVRIHATLKNLCWYVLCNASHNTILCDVSHWPAPYFPIHNI